MDMASLTDVTTPEDDVHSGGSIVAPENVSIKVESYDWNDSFTHNNTDCENDAEDTDFVKKEETVNSSVSSDTEGAHNQGFHRLGTNSTNSVHATGSIPIASGSSEPEGSGAKRLVSRKGIPTAEKPFACDLCDYICEFRADLIVHRIIHNTGGKPFACDSCDYRCGSTELLKRHRMTHTGEKPYACDSCDFRSSRAEHLKSHKMIHTGEKPFACNSCEYTCKRSEHLKRHMMTHTGEKPFACDSCNYTCSRAELLKRHVRTHTGEKPFACDVCGHRCSRSSNLRIHMRTHIGDKPFTCALCDYRCSRASYLRIHMRTHTGDYPFACDLCDFRCSRASALTRHKSTAHGSNLAEEEGSACDSPDDTSKNEENVGMEDVLLVGSTETPDNISVKLEYECNDSVEYENFDDHGTGSINLVEDVTIEYIKREDADLVLTA